RDSEGTIIASSWTFKFTLIPTNIPGRKFPSLFWLIARNCTVRVVASMFGAMAYTLPVDSPSTAALVKVITAPCLTTLAYLSGMEKSILIGSIFTTLTITSFGVMTERSEERRVGKERRYGGV